MVDACRRLLEPITANHEPRTGLFCVELTQPGRYRFPLQLYLQLDRPFCLGEMCRPMALQSASMEGPKSTRRKSFNTAGPVSLSGAGAHANKPRVVLPDTV